MSSRMEITTHPAKLWSKLEELWDNRELIGLLAWRDIRVRYAQTLVGFVWAALNPLINLLLLTFVFNRVAGVATEGVPSLIYGAAGLVGWTFFAEAMNKSGESLLSNQNMVQKIYFPRLALPLSAVISSIPDLLVSLFLVLLLMVVYGYFEVQNAWALIVILPLLTVASVTAGVWISALTIRFRDFRFITPLFLRLGLFLVPIAYPATQVPETYRTIYFLNPLAGLVESLKWSLLDTTALPHEVWFGLPVLLVVFFIGLRVFNRVSAYAADYL